VTGWLHTEISVWHRELNPDGFLLVQTLATLSDLEQSLCDS